METSVSEKTRIPLVMSINERYVAPLATLIVSILKNAPSERAFEFNILGTGLSAESQELIRSLGHLSPHSVFNIHDMNPIAEALGLGNFEVGHLPKEALYRLYSTKIFPHHAKVLYIDTDTLVLDDLGKVYDVDISDYYAAVVAEVFDCPQCAASEHSWIYPHMSMEEYSRHHLGKKKACYFNSGMMLLNLDLIRRDGKDELFVPFLKEKFPLDALDQCVLNAILEDKLLFLDRRWNVCRHMLSYYDRLPQNVVEELKAAFANPGVIHYTLGAKPWVLQNEDVELISLWWKYYAMTPCEGTRFAIRVLTRGRKEVGAFKSMAYKWLVGGSPWQRMLAKTAVSVRDCLSRLRGGAGAVSAK